MRLQRGIAVIFLALPLAAAPATIEPKDVVAHLERTIQWYRHLSQIDSPPGDAGDALLRDNLRRRALRSVQLAFEFARAEVALLNTKPGGVGAEPGANNSNRMQQVSARAAARVVALETAIAKLDAAIERAPEGRQALLQAQRRQLASELALARKIQDAVQNFANFNDTAASDASSSLSAQIGQFERSVPEAAPGRQNATAKAPERAAVDPESVGMIGLVGELISISQARSRIGDLAEETDALLNAMKGLNTPLSGDLRLTIRRSDVMASAPPSTDVDTVNAARREIESLGADFKQLSAAALPFREQSILVESSRGDLAQWRASLGERAAAAGRVLVTRAVILGVAIGLVLLISQLWRRMTFRYVRDARRRRQFLVLRRVAITGAVLLILAFGLVSEVGSLATYAGFLTAGLALALQNPILSVVGYFFLIGRYGLRVGDRVTIGGVTGEIIDLGLMRLYMMELEGSGVDRHTTGRIVVFSNAVLFQPSALFKQMPGTDYLWRTVTVTLAPETDSDLAQRKLMEAVDSVYGEYRAQIEAQHEAFERSVDVRLAPPAPDGRLRLTGAGLEFTVRYPADLKRAPEIDHRVIRALEETIAREPELKLEAAGGPRLADSR